MRPAISHLDIHGIRIRVLPDPPQGLESITKGLNPFREDDRRFMTTALKDAMRNQKPVAVVKVGAFLEVFAPCKTVQQIRDQESKTINGPRNTKYDW